VVSNALFVFGGSNNGALILAEMYRPAANLQPDGWAGLSGMLSARSEAAAAVVGDIIYVVGGQNAGAPGGLATLDAFSILEPNQFSLAQGGGGSGTPTVTWRLSPSGGVAAISPSGNVFANAPGQVTVIAESGAVSCVTTNTCGRLTVTNPVDSTPPVIVSITPSARSLTPPDHKMVPVSFAVQATDLVDPSPVCDVVSVASNEPANGLGDGNTAADWSFVPGSLTVSLRAERSGTGSGRVYTVTIRCRDASGNAAFSTAEVAVPK